MKYKIIPIKSKLSEDQKKNVKEWIAALRSGKYKQGRLRLVDSYDTYCCLGVACNLEPLAQKQEKGFIFPNTDTFNSNFEPPREWFLEKYGFVHNELVMNKPVRCSLMGLNDTYSFTFPQIARVLELSLLEKVEFEFNNSEDLITP